MQAEGLMQPWRILERRFVAGPAGIPGNEKEWHTPCEKLFTAGATRSPRRFMSRSAPSSSF